MAVVPVAWIKEVKAEELQTKRNQRSSKRSRKVVSPVFIVSKVENQCAMRGGSVHYTEAKLYH